MTNLWAKNGNCVGAIPAAHNHFFVMLTIDGQRHEIQPITEYDAVLAKAHRLAGDTSYAIKVLPLTFNEALACMDISQEDFVAGLKPAVVTELRELAVDAGWTALRTCNDPKTRDEAYRLLVDLGAIKR